MVTPSRKDTVGLKQQLADALGESGKDYWTKLGEFLQGKATKQELDQTAKLVILTPHQEHLHNQLLLSILHNVQHSVPRPSGPTDGGYVVRNHSLSKRVRRKTEEINPLQLKKRFLQQTMCSMPKEDRSRILSLEQQPAQPVQNIFQKNLFPFGFPKGVDSIPRTCVEEGDLPTKETLKQRIRFISAVQGLAGQPSNEVVDLISLALENYMKKLTSVIVSSAGLDVTVEDGSPIQRHLRQHSDASIRRKKDRNHIEMEHIEIGLGLNPIVHPDIHEQVTCQL